MNVIVCDRLKVIEIREEHKNDRVTVISITDPGTKMVTFPRIYEKHRLCRFQFHDYVDFDNEYSPTKEDAEAIVRIVNDLYDNETLIVHCEAGVSRSASVGLMAKAYWDGFESAERRFMNKGFCPNNVLSKHFDDILNMNGKLFELSEKIVQNHLERLTNSHESWDNEINEAFGPLFN